MESQRYTNLSIYSQKGGSQSSSTPKRATSSPKKSKAYTPSDTDSSTSIHKLFKANRLLQEELDNVKSQLKKATEELKYEKNKNKLRGF